MFWRWLLYFLQRGLLFNTFLNIDKTRKNIYKKWLKTARALWAQLNSPLLVWSLFFRIRIHKKIMDPHTGCYIFFSRMIKIKKVICLIKTCLPLRQRNKKNLNLRKIGILVFYVLISEEHRGSNILRVLDPGSGNIEIKNRIRIHPQGLFDL